MKKTILVSLIALAGLVNMPLQAGDAGAGANAYNGILTRPASAISETRIVFFIFCSILDLPDRQA